MNTVVDDFEDIGKTRKDREIHLSTGTVLGIFFGLALVCALFFGFGYTAGRRSAIGSSETAEAGSPGFGNFKPAPGAVAIQPVAGYMTAKQAADANANANSAQHFYGTQTASTQQPQTVNYSVPATTTAAAKPVQLPKVSHEAVEAAPAPVVKQTVASVAQPQVPVAQPVSLPVAQGPAMVQVAAVSHQEDADVLLSALKRHGYAVFTTSAPTDRLIHVQLGPFQTRKDADAMRQRLLSDGYNAIVK